MTTRTPQELEKLAKALLIKLGSTVDAHLPELTGTLHKPLVDASVELQGDQGLIDLLYASIESNLETTAHVFRYDIPVEGVSTPAASEEYARRLAQRGISSNALVRAYRLGQQLFLDWAFTQFTTGTPDPEVALAAGRLAANTTFRYIDSVSQQVVAEYEAERERWLATRSTVRAAMIRDVLAGETADLASAEQALGYRLRQHHVGVVIWTEPGMQTSIDVQQMERLLLELARTVGASGQPLFVPKDRTLAWGWIPMSAASVPHQADLRSELGRVSDGVHVALGTPVAGAPGFRASHLEALRAHQVALAAGPDGDRLTSYDDSDVRIAAFLAGDPEATRRLVDQSLGSLADDTESAQRLRETLLVFLQEKGSYLAAADRLQMHKNTVKYRIDKAVDERGRPLDEERLELQLALIACTRLGKSVIHAA